jgi:hypothetical protein
VNIGALTPADVAALGDRLVYVGRPVRRSRHAIARAGSPWGNPFRPNDQPGLGSCLDRYRAWLLSQPQLLALLPTLKGKVLACWCCHSVPADEPGRVCHAEILLDLVDELT